MTEAPRAVDHAVPGALEALQPGERVADPGSLAAPPRRRTHAVEDHLPFAAAFGGGIEHVMRDERFGVVDAAPIELGEQPIEPARVLVVDDKRRVNRGWPSGLPGGRPNPGTRR